jgi:hypothetical protein
LLPRDIALGGWKVIAKQSSCEALKPITIYRVIFRRQSTVDHSIGPSSWRLQDVGFALAALDTSSQEKLVVVQIESLSAREFRALHEADLILLRIGPEYPRDVLNRTTRWPVGATYHHTRMAWRFGRSHP